MDTTVRYPFGPADVQSADYAAAIAVTIKNAKTFLTIGQMTAGATLNLTIEKDVPAGATLTVRTSADGTNRTLTPGTGMTGNGVSNTASKSFSHTYEYDGSTFVHVTSQLLN